jgi:hypothetical protein
LAVAVLLGSAPALGEGDAAAKAKVSGLVKEAMDAYSNLDLTAATGALEEALGYAPDLDKTTLARLYIAYGTIRIGGSGDNASGQRDFATALCLDSGVMIDPLMSTPDIDAVFTMAKQQATPANCPNVLSTIVLPAGMGTGPGPGPGPTSAADPGVPPCGMHTAPTALKQRYELPLYLELDPMMRTRLAKVVVKYSFDGSPEYKEIQVTPAGAGFGALVTCDEGQIRLYDPASIGYYIEGFDRLGNLICGHGTGKGPFVVAMTPDASPLPGIQGLPIPKECAPCPPWDQSCGQGKPGEGAMCDPAVGCAEGLTCGEAGICEPESSAAGAPKGPKRFYVNVTGGAGFGAMSQKIKITEIVQNDNDDDILQTSSKNPNGAFAFSGVPLRLVVGVQLIEKLAVELTGRLDMTRLTTADNYNQSCLEAAGGEINDVPGLACTPVNGMGNEDGLEPFNETTAAQSVALTAPLEDGGKAVVKSTKHIAKAWLVNARARFNFLQKGGLRMSVFGGLGYGHIIYMVPSNAGGTYYFQPGFFNIEVGPGLAYYFTDNVGLTVEVPIDVLVGDGWAVNFDLAVGLSFGF